MLNTYCNKINRLTTPCQKERKNQLTPIPLTWWLTSDVITPLYNLAVLNKVTKKCRFSLLSLF